MVGTASLAPIWSAPLKVYPGATAVVITKLARYVTISVFCVIPLERFSHETIQKHFLNGWTRTDKPRSQ